jgi:hypothetical protein
MNRKAIVISVGALIATMAFVGMAYSLDGTNARVVPTPQEIAEVSRSIAEASRKAPGTKERMHPSPRVDGQTWGLRSYTNVAKEVCLSHDVPGELVGSGCISPAKLFARGPIYALPGARQEPAPYAKTEWDSQWVYGIVHPDVATLTVVSMDCSTQDLALDEHGAFNHVVGKEKIKRGELMYKLIARDSAGQMVGERIVNIGLSQNAQRAGHEAPTPKAACR